jgi:hypothetical protein
MEYFRESACPALVGSDNFYVMDRLMIRKLQLGREKGYILSDSVLVLAHFLDYGNVGIT